MLERSVPSAWHLRPTPLLRRCCMPRRPFKASEHTGQSGLRNTTSWRRSGPGMLARPYRRLCSKMSAATAHSNEPARIVLAACISVIVLQKLLATCALTAAAPQFVCFCAAGLFRPPKTLQQWRLNSSAAGTGPSFKSTFFACPSACALLTSLMLRHLDL